jgi:hypothetical protein
MVIENPRGISANGFAALECSQVVLQLVKTTGWSAECNPQWQPGQRFSISGRPNPSLFSAQSAGTFDTRCRFGTLKSF